MEERTKIFYQKALYFEKSGETISIEINLGNVSPETKRETIISFLDTLYEHVVKEITNQ